MEVSSGTQDSMCSGTFHLGKAMANTLIGGDFGGIDFSKLGGGAGLPTGDDEEDSDDDMPPLEGEEEEEKGETAEDAKDAKEAVSSS